MSEAMERAVKLAVWATDGMSPYDPDYLATALRAAFPVLAEELVAFVAAQPKLVPISAAHLHQNAPEMIADALRTRISEIAGGRDG